MPSIHIGSKIQVQLNNQTMDLEIVDDNNTNPDLGKISPFSPLGQAILQKMAGETIYYSTPINPHMKVTIQKVYPE